MKAAIRCSLRILSPLHLGCDEVYEPMGFGLNEQEKRLIAFDSLDFFRALSLEDRKRFSEICRRGTVTSLLEIYKFMRNRPCSGISIEVCEGFLEHYQQTLNIASGDSKRIQNELNRFAIARTSYNPVTGLPYLPGSAIKGALRTAYLNERAAMRQMATPHGDKAARDLESILLDRDRAKFVETDPFRMLQVCDFHPVGNVKTKIVYAVNRKLNPSKFEARAVHQILEVVETGSIFTGSISVIDPMDGSGIRTPLKMEQLLSSAADFYTKGLERETAGLQGVGGRPVAAGSEPKLCLLRLGRHSGAECVTIRGHRQIRIMQGKDKPPKTGKNATTLWLASPHRHPESNQGLLPFGWASLERMTEAMAAEFEHAEAERYREGLVGRRKCFEMQPAIHAAKAKLAPSRAQIEVPRKQRWAKAQLSWSPGNRMVTAVWEGKKATGIGKELVPECFRERLCDKKRPVTANIEVEPEGNAFKIVTIEPLP